MATAVSMRLQTPADSNGNRKDINLFTTSNEVIMDPSVGGGSATLTDKVNQLANIQIQSNQPSFPCIWAKPID